MFVDAGRRGNLYCLYNIVRSRIIGASEKLRVKAKPQNQQGQNVCPAIPKGPGKDELDANIRDALDARSGILNMFGVLGPSAKFVGDVAPGGPQDYKLKGDGWDAFGNFNYGAVGAAYGFDISKLKAAASLVQSYENLTERGDITFGDNLGSGLITATR
jgi:hypothetical protein